MPLPASSGAEYQQKGGLASGFIEGMDARASLMDRAAQRRAVEQRTEQQKAEFIAKLPLIQAEATKTIESARAAVKARTDITNFETKAAEESPGLNAEYLKALELPSFEEQARALSALQPRVAFMAAIPGPDGAPGPYKGFVDAVNNATVRAHGSALADMQLNRRTTDELRTFQALTKGMTPEEVSDAAKINLGLKGRQSGAAIQYKEVVGPDGRPILVAVDPRAVGAQVVGGGQRYGTGVDNAQPNVAAGAPGTEVFAGQTAGERKTQEAEAQRQVDLAKAKPKRQASLAQAEIASQRLASDIDKLISKVKVSTAGPGGVILNRFPGTTARDLKADLDAITAVLGFQALQAMRDASPTGGALGPVSDYENKLTQTQLGNLEIGQSPSQLIENLTKVKQRVGENMSITRTFFANEYPDQQPANAAAPDFKTMSTEQLQQRLQQLRGTP